MGSLDSPFELSAGMAVNLPDDVFVVANPEEIERLRKAAGQRRVADLTFVALHPAELVPDEVVARAALLVMEVDPADRASVRRIAQVRASRHDLPLIVALQNANVSTVRTLLRQGVND
ncbi:MAG TPA: hypothetical protein VEC60_21490, partial [Reyranella sp.]|nr:hypothetical protein [Reyranella sp.]